MWRNWFITDSVIACSGQFVENKKRKSQKGLWWINYCSLSCFTLNSTATGAGLIICVNKKDAILSFILKLCPSLRSPLSPYWLDLTVPASHPQRWLSVPPVLPQSHPSPADGLYHGRSRYETREEIRHYSPFIPGAHFSATGKARLRHLLVVNVIYPLSICLVVANVAIEAAMLSINTDLSASTAVGLWISSGDNEDASGGGLVEFLELQSIGESIIAYMCLWERIRVSQCCFDLSWKILMGGHFSHQNQCFFG